MLLSHKFPWRQNVPTQSDISFQNENLNFIIFQTPKNVKCLALGKNKKCER
jgi:hypothetical protein